MGFWGSFLVCRTAGSVLDLAAVVERTEGLDDEHTYLGGWRVGQFSGPELADNAARMLAELVGETNAPALTGFVLDSDAVIVEGLSRVTGYWRACLAREAMEGYCEDDGQDFHAQFPTAEQATASAVGWATHAGLTPDPDALLRTFQTAQADLFAEELFFTMLTHLGLRP